MIVPTVRLYEIAAAEEIELITHDLPAGVLGFYFAEPDTTPVIALSPMLKEDSSLYRCVLAEELGHHFTTAGSAVPKAYCHYHDRLTISRAEYRALKWASEFLIPWKSLLRQRRRGVTEPWEVGEVFGVTEEMARFRLRLAYMEQCA